jgi:hypothetical protein
MSLSGTDGHGHIGAALIGVASSMSLTATELHADAPRCSEYAPKARRVADACSALGISRATLYKLSLQGKVKLVKIAGRTVVPEAEIDRLASEGTA